MASEKIDMTIEDVKACADMGLGQRDAYCDMLLATGKAANGSTDKIKDTASAIESIAICMTRDAMHRIPDIKAAIEEVVTRVVSSALDAHKKDCPLAQEWDGRDRRGNQASVTVKGVKTKADPGTVRFVGVCIVLCFAIAAYIVRTIEKGG